MKKLCLIIAFAAITFGSVYAGIPVKAGNPVAASDTTKKKVKVKGTKTKVKVKKDTTKTSM